jgi:coenzyme F420 hydrogenase subunit beta
MKIRSLQDIVKADLCVGCGLCESIAGHSKVEMRLNAEGFYRPFICQDIDGSIWQEINQVCPGIKLRKDAFLNSGNNEIIWGVVQHAAVGYANDEEIRFQASSGGALSAILVYLLENRHVDYVLHIGVSEDNPFVSTVGLSRSRKDILQRSGSRYVPTAPLTKLVDLLNRDNVKFAIVGKPCDIAAVRTYMDLYPETKSRIVVLISFFCAGVPSILATYDLVQEFGLKKEQIRKFRYRGFGWPGKATALTLDGQEYSMSYNESWGGILGRNLQFRCKICPDGIGEFADIVCGDAWVTKDGYPDFEERPGKSLVLARTEHGEGIVNSAAQSNHLILESFPGFDTLSLMQPYQKKRRQAIIPRLLALRMVGRATPHYRGFGLWRGAFKAGMVFFVRQFVGMLYRVSKQ